MGNSGIPGQLTLSFERSKISDNPFPVINSKDGDGDGGEVVVTIETKNQIWYFVLTFCEKKMF